MATLKVIFLTLMLALSLAHFTISVVLTGYSIYTAIGYRRALSRPIVTVPIDLSVRGETKIELEPSYSGEHGARVFVDGPPLTPKHLGPEPWLHDLQATITGDIPAASGGTEKMEPVIFPDDLYPRGASNTLFRIPVRYGGPSVLTITVTNPATKLAGQSHQLRIMHIVCGCETTGAILATVFALPGLIQGVVVNSIVRNRRARSRQSDDEATVSSAFPPLAHT